MPDPAPLLTAPPQAASAVATNESHELLMPRM
jgi:hypothetical protein